MSGLPTGWDTRIPELVCMEDAADDERSEFFELCGLVLLGNSYAQSAIIHLLLHKKTEWESFAIHCRDEDVELLGRRITTSTSDVAKWFVSNLPEEFQCLAKGILLESLFCRETGQLRPLDILWGLSNIFSHDICIDDICERVTNAACEDDTLVTRHFTDPNGPAMSLGGHATTRPIAIALLRRFGGDYATHAACMEKITVSNLGMLPVYFNCPFSACDHQNPFWTKFAFVRHIKHLMTLESCPGCGISPCDEAHLFSNRGNAKHRLLLECKIGKLDEFARFAWHRARLELLGTGYLDLLKSG